MVAFWYNQSGNLLRLKTTYFYFIFWCRQLINPLQPILYQVV